MWYMYDHIVDFLSSYHTDKMSTMILDGKIVKVPSITNTWHSKWLKKVTPFTLWIILETKRVDHFIINEALLGRRLLLTYHTKDGEIQSYNHDKYHFNHKKLIAGQKEWEVNRIFSDLSKGLIPKLKK